MTNAIDSNVLEGAAARRRRPLRPTTTMRVALSIVRRSLPGSKVAVVPYDEGRSRIAADLTTPHGLALFRYRQSWEPELDLVGKLLKPGDCFVDGGASIGLYTLVAAARVGQQGAVVAYEPNPATRRRLEENVALNAFNWVQIRSEALAESSGSETFTAFEGPAAAYSSFAPPPQPGGSSREVTTTTLDQSLDLRLRERVKLVKLDLEGAEARALRGAADLIRMCRPDFLIELEADHLARQNASPAEIAGILRPFGYQFYRVLWDAQRRPRLRHEPDPNSASHTNLYATADSSCPALL